MNQQIALAARGVSCAEQLDVVGLLQEMRDRLVADFSFEHVRLAGEGHINRTTEPVLRFLVWLERTPEAQVALQLAFGRLAAGTAPRKGQKTRKGREEVRN